MFGSRSGSECASSCIADFPITHLQLLDRPVGRVVTVTLPIVQPLAIDTRAGRNHETFHWVKANCLKEGGRTQAIDTGIAGDLVHALAYSHQRNEVDHRIDTL
jgi:hypothetical protein